MKRTLFAYSVLFTLTLLVFSCGNSSVENSELVDSTEAGITTVSSVADETASGVSVSSIEDVEAAAVNCSGSWEACGSGVRTREMTCSNNGIDFAKSTTMTFYESNDQQQTLCNMSSNGQYFVREHNTVRTHSRGSFTSVSTALNNYLGESIGGGSKVTKLASGYSINILGINKKLEKDGAEVWSHSIKTDASSPLLVNQFSRDGRTISSGKMYVYHNNLQYRVSMEFNNVQYSVSCCYPVAGTITVALEGSMSGIRTITFSSTCGSATISDGSAPQAITLSTCEQETDSQ